VEKYRPVHLDDVVSHQDITATSKLPSQSDGGDKLIGSREVHRSGQITPFVVIRSTRYVSMLSSVSFSSRIISEEGSWGRSKKEERRKREEEGRK